MAINPNIINSSSTKLDYLLPLAALFEGSFSIDWIVELAELKPSQVLLCLEEGINRGLLAGMEPGVYSFSDLQKRRNFRTNLPPEQQAQIHKKIASILLRDLPDDQNKALAVAVHLFNFQNDLETLHWLLKAGDSYRRIFRIEDALACYKKVLKDLSNCEGEVSDLLFIETALEYSEITTARNIPRLVTSMLQEAMARAKKLDRQPYQALIEMHIAKNEWYLSHYSVALSHFEKGWSLAKKLGNPKLIRSATTFSTFFLYWQGRFREAVLDYEKSAADIEKYPAGKFPLIASLTVGRCYAHIGQITQGLGMVDSIQKQSLERGDKYSAAHARFLVGSIMLDIGLITDAIQALEIATEEATIEHNLWPRIMGKLCLALAYFLIENNEGCLTRLHEFLRESENVHLPVRSNNYLIELCWAMEQGKLSRISGLSLNEEMNQMIKGENIFLRGVAYRFQALLQKQMGLPNDEIIQSFNLSQKCLEDSGHQSELAKTYLELGRLYLVLGEEERAKNTIKLGSKILYSINKALIPDDLKPLIQDLSVGENPLKEILSLGQEIATIRDTKDLVQQIISAVNHITGAERGAIFFSDDSVKPPRLQLRASKNLTSEQISDPNFASSMNMIKEVAETGKSYILGINLQEENSSHVKEIIRSRICVPMILRDKVIGVLYHDNRLLKNAFKKSDLDLLAYFAAQAAIAMDNAGAYEEIQRLNRKLNEEKLYYKEAHLENFQFADIVGESLAIMEVLNQINQVAGTDAAVLISGETGVGKELVAREIHRHSPRCDKPFIRAFCSALPESLIPSELFGHERGAFTGAYQRRIGRFELADGGTLFLDEIGELPLDVQVRFLQVLQSKEFERVGGSETIHSDFRLIAATNRDLEQEVKNHRFRSDLFYRINVFPISVPPLRDRKEDIPLLAYYFLKNYATKMGKTFKGIPESEMDKFIQYNWPGNVRELENIIERGAILSTGQDFRVPKLGLGHQDFGPSKDDRSLKENERRHILWALQKTRWKVRGFGGAAELLNIHPSTLEFRIKKLGIQKPLEFKRRRRKSPESPAPWH
jgi:formate hydrogenlyase transcriptional activator